MVGSDPLPRPEVVSKVWDYIKKNQLQDPQNKREIVADDKLRAVFGKERVTMFEMNKHLVQGAWLRSQERTSSQPRMWRSSCQSGTATIRGHDAKR